MQTLIAFALLVLIAIPLLVHDRNQTGLAVAAAAVALAYASPPASPPSEPAPPPATA